MYFNFSFAVIEVNLLRMLLLLAGSLYFSRSIQTFETIGRIANEIANVFFLRCWDPRGKNPYSALLNVLPFIPALVLVVLAEIRDYSQVNQ